MTGSYLSEFDLGTTIKELQMSEAKSLIRNSKALQAEYRRSAELSKNIYELAWMVLDHTLGEENISLPIDVRQVADVLGFVVSSDDFSDVELEYILSDHDCLPVAQLKMRQKLFGREGESICGTIRIANNLNENSTRFSIAHELGHVVLRHQNPIGSSVVREACPGMYPLVDTEEMLADMFAQAMLLPYKLFQKEREEYEKDRTHWPLDFSTWIAYIRDKAQIPEYHAVIACQEIKKRDIIERAEQADRFFQQGIRSMIDGDPAIEGSYSAIKSLYANTVFNLEGWGFSSEQVADILFGDWKGTDRIRNSQVQRDIVSVLHDYRLETEIEKKENYVPKQEPVPGLPSSIQRHIIDALYEAGLSENGIMKVTGIENINFEQEDTTELLPKNVQILDAQNEGLDNGDMTGSVGPISESDDPTSD